MLTILVAFLFSAFSSLHFRSLCKMYYYYLQQIDKLINTSTNVLQFFPSPPQGEVNWFMLILLLNCSITFCQDNFPDIFKGFWGLSTSHDGLFLFPVVKKYFQSIILPLARY